MIIEIQQTVTNGNALYDIYFNGVLTYKASATFGQVNWNNLRFFDLAGNTIYYTKYNVLENLKEALVPFKNIIMGRQKAFEYQLLNFNHESVGSFYAFSNGLLDEKTIISFGANSYIGYDVSAGKIRTVSFYDREFEFAQMVKPLATKGNLDRYFIYLLDSHNALAPIMAFFAIYFDYVYYANLGEFVSKKFYYRKLQIHIQQS